MTISMQKMPLESALDKVLEDEFKGVIEEELSRESTQIEERVHAFFLSHRELFRPLISTNIDKIDVILKSTLFDPEMSEKRWEVYRSVCLAMKKFDSIGMLLSATSGDMRSKWLESHIFSACNEVDLRWFGHNFASLPREYPRIGGDGASKVTIIVGMMFMSRQSDFHSIDFVSVMRKHGLCIDDFTKKLAGEKKTLATLEKKGERLKQKYIEKKESLALEDKRREELKGKQDSLMSERGALGEKTRVSRFVECRMKMKLNEFYRERDLWKAGSEMRRQERHNLAQLVDEVGKGNEQIRARSIYIAILEESIKRYLMREPAILGR